MVRSQWIAARDNTGVDSSGAPRQVHTD